MKTTVKELMGALMGRDPNDVIEISGGEINIITKQDLMSIPSVNTKVLIDSFFEKNTSSKEIRLQADPVPAPEPAQKKKIARRAWPDTDIETLIMLYDRDVELKTIGSIMNRTPKAIECRLHILRTENKISAKPKVVGV